MSDQIVFISYVADRHIDPEIKVFSNLDQCIAYTRHRFDNLMAHPDGIYEEEVDGYLLSLFYKYESDHAYVIEAEIESEAGDE